MNRMEKMLAAIEGNIAEHGTQVIGVHPCANSPHQRSFAYTIGMEQSYGHPEIIIAGLRCELMHIFLNQARDQVRDHGMRYEAGQQYQGLAGDDYPTAFREVLVLPEYYTELLGHAVRYYQSRAQKLRTPQSEHPGGFRVLQMFWPDTHKRFPWEVGFERRFVDKQPLLYLPPGIIEGGEQ